MESQTLLRKVISHSDLESVPFPGAFIRTIVNGMKCSMPVYSYIRVYRDPLFYGCTTIELVYDKDFDRIQLARSIAQEYGYELVKLKVN